MTRLICEACGADATGEARATAPCPYCGGVLARWTPSRNVGVGD